MVSALLASGIGIAGAILVLLIASVVIGAAVGAVTGAITGAILAYVSHEAFGTDTEWGDYAKRGAISGAIAGGFGGLSGGANGAFSASLKN